MDFTKDEADIITGINTTEHLTDLGNAKRFIATTKGLFRYLYDLGKWGYYDGKVWRLDKSGDKLSQISELTVRSIYQEAADAEDKKTREALGDHARRSESAAKIKAMVSLSEPRLSLDVEKIDLNPWLLNCRNGTIDLRTGGLIDHDPDNLIDKMIDVDYDPNAECPEWEKFLKVIMQDDEDMVYFIQKMVGYCMTGIIDERAFFVLHGAGKNGKSVFCETLAKMLSGYGQKIAADALLVKKFGDDAKRDLANLRGIRFVYASETSEGRRLAENKIKEITGGDTVVGRFLYHEQFQYRPVFKLLLHTNHKPEIRGTDDAIWDRVKLIPFNHRFDGKVSRQEVDKLFEREFPGILRWAVDGCLLWQSGGLETPEQILNATNQYKDESDVLAEFLEDRCVIGNNTQVDKSDLYNNYIEWTESNKEKYPLSKIKFGKNIKERGVDEGRVGDKRFWLGIGLIR